MKKKKRKVKKKFKKRLIILVLIILVLALAVILENVGSYYLEYNKPLKEKIEKKDYYTISDFGFIVPITGQDEDKDGIDDGKDIFEGAKTYASYNPKYISNYYAGGYPPVKEEGVCTDLIWFAIKEAGYPLKDMISYDMKKNKSVYNTEILDENIDFRRVGNQEIFFLRHLESLETDMYEIGEFMPGDIVTFDYSSHIAMISDKYNKNGVPYLIQNRDEDQKQKEEDRLEVTDMKITGHYRFTKTKEIEKLLDKMN